MVRVAPDGPGERGSLQRAVAELREAAELRLEPGHYHLAPVAFTDSTCGNCQDAATPVPATLGLRLSTPGLRIVADHADSVFIHTNATDAAVVVRNGRVTLRSCTLRDKIGDSASVAATVVGIAGIAGREGADIQVDGVDAARGARVGGGRGVGIGATWDARAVVRGTLVRNYWKGIGAFVDAELDARHNIIEDILIWGFAFWGAGDGSPEARIRDNVVYRTGACGIIVDRSSPVAAGEDPGELTGNLLVATGQDERYDSGDPYCHQRAIARHAVPPGFRGVAVPEGSRFRGAASVGSQPLT